MNPPTPQRTSLRQRPAVRLAALSAALCAALCSTPIAQATGDSPYIGELMLFGGDFCPDRWMPAAGQTVPVNGGNEALFALLSTTYGGDGIATFKLPDLRGRSAVGTSTGAGMAQQALGQQGGTETVVLLPANLPPHIHSLPASTLPATHASPAAGRVLASAQNAGVYATGGALVDLQGTSTAGGSPQAISVRGPYLAMQWCIAIEGIYPSRP